MIDLRHHNRRQRPQPILSSSWTRNPSPTTHHNRRHCQCQCPPPGSALGRSVLVRKYLPKSVVTAKGHLDQHRSNLQSNVSWYNDATVRNESTAPQDETTEALHPALATSSRIRSHCIYAACAPINGQVYTDQTGRFLVPLSHGNNNLMALYDHDINTILAEPAKDQTDRQGMWPKLFKDSTTKP
jgi:hypothetical protein